MMHFNTESFDQALAEGKLMMVDFWAAWCGPCRMLAPMVDDLAAKYEGKAVVGKVNVDEEQELAAQFGVMSIPTLMIVKNGEVVNKSVGAKNKQQILAMFR